MTDRKTLSFYRYVSIEDPLQLYQELKTHWRSWHILGRTYISKEGINAQISVPLLHLDDFTQHIRQLFPDIPFKRALEERTNSFRKLKIKIREKIVADGLNDRDFDTSDVGSHLSAREFHEAMDQKRSIVVDMRNHYECEVGHFEGAYLPAASTFREALPEVAQYLKGKEDYKILLYCTGGIRCEKASAWLRHQGFKDVNQLHGGIIDYAHQIREEKLESRFKGVNFVFDDRLGERVTNDVLAVCHQCHTPWDQHSNCRNPGCNLLFIQCPQCANTFENCCSFECRDVTKLPKEEQVRWQNEREASSPKFLRSRQRPDLLKKNQQYLGQLQSGSLS